MAFLPQLLYLTTNPRGAQAISQGPPGSAAIIVNVGGQSVTINGQTTVLPGPDAAILTADAGDQEPAMFLLPAGAALAFPGDIGVINARAATSATTLSYALGFSEPQ